MRKLGSCHSPQHLGQESLRGDGFSRFSVIHRQGLPGTVSLGIRLRISRVEDAVNDALNFDDVGGGDDFIRVNGVLEAGDVDRVFEVVRIDNIQANGNRCFGKFLGQGGVEVDQFLQEPNLNDSNWVAGLRRLGWCHDRFHEVSSLRQAGWVRRWYWTYCWVHLVYCYFITLVFLRKLKKCLHG